MRSIIPFVLPLFFSLVVQSAVVEKSESSAGDELPEIFCAEEDLPKNLTCNFDKLLSYPPFSEVGMSDLLYMDFEFPIEDPFRKVCVVSYMKKESESPSLLILQFNTCLTDEKLHYKMHDSSRLTLLHGGQNFTLCEFTFMYQKTIVGGTLKNKSLRRSVVFRLKDCKCHSLERTSLIDGANYSEGESIRDPKTNRERPSKSEK